MTPSGIEPAIFRFVAQHLNHCATAIPLTDTDHDLKRPTDFSPPPQKKSLVDKNFATGVKTDRHSEVCHPRCVFKLYGEVSSVKNTTINIWLNPVVMRFHHHFTCGLDIVYKILLARKLSNLKMAAIGRNM